MTTKVLIDGQIVSEQEAVIPVWDRGFLYGDSIYEVIRTYGGRPYLLHDHLQRLERSAGCLGIELSGGLAPISAEVERTVRASDNLESYIRVIVTRGSGPIGLDPALADQPRRLVIVAELKPFPEAYYREGVKIALVSAGHSGERTIAQGAKSGNYLVNVLAVGAASRQGAQEAVLLDHRGRITEGASSNLFIVRQGILQTPPLSAGILEGITRRQIFQLAEAAGMSMEERILEPAHLRVAEEVFLTSTLREVWPVTRVDDWAVSNGRPGPVTRKLLAAYREAAAAGVTVAGER